MRKISGTKVRYIMRRLNNIFLDYTSIHEKLFINVPYSLKVSYYTAKSLYLSDEFYAENMR